MSSLKLISWNVNGIRAVERKEELQKFIEKHNPDVLFIQETKSREEQVQTIIEKYSEYDQHYYDAETKKGYAGTAVWIKKSLGHEYIVSRGMDTTHAKEGRLIQVECDGYALIGVYFPNGGKSPAAWEDKLMYYKDFHTHINILRKQHKKVIWCGDVNTAHNEIDLARPKDNEGEIGFHPKERAWIDGCIKDNWIDIFREKYPEKVMYSWWHLITRARERNVGWRIDYFFVDKPLVKQVKDIYYDNDQMGSDHCPIILEIDAKHLEK
ncbi:MAG: exodeoxyribonuclease III [Candidatus Magasanikbacteria bacterium]|uniref:Exodeoxyribonuclease III n=1 Tax=Candidatus Magasanikbacteria bacterium CG10_big_fil_rev_8_21_14_0_10_38_6 TaxID=1974647 RepID=A0A2M6P0V1_9BACT|nr:exodeoxyribonuclease III [Candidatus Magasanikbacteria bacterium]NCS72325.1 exodeoxyribonuclease III [Candidatus Magasanikbacteria bacterium]PIR77362.1 MAG: exodeoxyribonuclease III [Candidatus Magasanikbacteria bacterium CG10_big_fil_rev_8_21_14_0_10_38_6]